VLDYARINNLEEKQFKEITDRKGENTHFTYTPVESMIIALWENPRLPIESQSEEAITYIFNLIEE
jgi:pyrrolidone-carboxylate peptidase